MMEDLYFVMLSHPNINPLPMTEDDEHVAYFNTLEEAKSAAEDNPLGENYGYEVFCIGRGE